MKYLQFIASLFIAGFIMYSYNMQLNPDKEAIKQCALKGGTIFWNLNTNWCFIHKR